MMLLMSKRIKRTEAGQGGRLGHSRMTHWTGTEEVKAETRRLRRRQKRLHIAEQFD